MSATNVDVDKPGSKYITEINVGDVLFGRGSGPNDHEGNIRFRTYVAERKAEYMATNHRVTKTNIARDIVNLVIADNGRFLKKLEQEEAQDIGLILPDGSNSSVTYYEIQDDDTIMEKAKQALRQNATKFREEMLLQQHCNIPAAPISRLTSDSAVVSSKTSGNATTNVANPRRLTAPAHMNKAATEAALQMLFGENSNFNESDLEPYPVHSTSSTEFKGHRGVSMNDVFSFSPNVVASDAELYTNSGGNGLRHNALMMQKQPYTGDYTINNTNVASQNSDAVMQMNALSQDMDPMSYTPSSNLNFNNNNVGVDNNINDIPSRSQYRRRTIHVMPQLEETMPISNEDMMAFNQLLLQQQQRLLSCQQSVSHPQFSHGNENTELRRNSLSKNDDNRRISITVSDLMNDHVRRTSSSHSDNHNPDTMDDLLDSFNAMSTATGISQKEREEQRNLMNSQQTMGTIEQLGSVADMSLATIDGSLFSTYGGTNNNIVDTGFLDSPPTLLVSTGTSHSNRKASITSTSTFGGFSIGMNESINGFIDQIRDGDSSDDDLDFIAQVQREVENDILRKQQQQKSNSRT